jgi:predicted PurR-regulated permease PerM
VFRWSVVGALGVLLVAFGALLLFVLRNLLIQIAVALFIAVSLDPLVRWLIRRKMNRSVAVALILGSFAVLIAVTAWLALPRVVSEAADLTSDFPGYLNDLRNRSPSLRDLEARLHLRPRVDAFAATFLDRLQSDAFAFGQQVLGALVSALLVIVLTIYFMADLPRLRRSVVRLFPVRQRPRVSHGLNVVIDKVGSYMIGNLLISFVAGVTSLIAMAALQVPFALPLAVFVAVFDLIPLVGATIAAVVCTVVAVATTDIWPHAVLLALFFVAYQQIENYFIAPRVYRNSVDISSVAVLLAALVGASMLGLVGALIAIPLAAAAKVIATPMLEARDAAHATGPPAPATVDGSRG